MTARPLPTGALVVTVMKDGTPVWEAKWRHDSKQVKRRIGKAWLHRSLGQVWKEEDKESPWRKRRGRPTAGYFDQRGASVEMDRIIREYAEEIETAEERAAEERAARALSAITLERAAEDWFHWAEHIKGMRPSTLTDHRYSLDGRILSAPEFAGKNVAEITSSDVRAWRDRLLKNGSSPRTTNKLRQLLSNVFNYAMKDETFGLASNPVAAVEKIKEPKPGRLEFFTPEEVKTLIRAAERGAHRRSRTPAGGAFARSEQVAARRVEDQQDAALFTVACYAGLRRGELLALRWRDIDFAARKVQIWRSYTGGKEGATKSDDPRSVPMVDQVASALVRLKERESFTTRDDLVFCDRTGGYLDESAVRRRYVKARDAAGLRPLRFHDLRHSFASTAMRAFALHEVQTFLGHSDARTTRRYVHFRPEPDHADRLTKAFEPTPPPAPKKPARSRPRPRPKAIKRRPGSRP